MRLCSVIAIVLMLAGYQVILKEREQTEQIEKLRVERDMLKENVASYEKQLKTTVGMINQNSAKADNTEIDMIVEDEPDGAYIDGEYTASAQGFGGDIEIKAIISDGALYDIEIVSAKKEDPAYLSMAQDIIIDMLDSQSAEVDTVSGATFSSTGIKNAVKQALEQAVRN